MGSFLEDLKQEIQCSLCNDTLTEPKILPCFHTFCKLCIKRHAELIEEVNVFKCPRCKSETTLPELLSSVEDLKPSLLHSRMLKVLEFVEIGKACSVSGSHSFASWHCFDCDRSLCDECEKYHPVFTRDHKVVSLVEIKEEDIKLMLSRESNCVNHVGKLIELFCQDCEEIICFECFKHDHEGHSTITLSKYAESKRALLTGKLDLLTIREQTMENNFKTMQEATEILRNSGEKEKRVIKKNLEETIKELKIKAMELMNQIDDDVEKAEKMKVKGQSLLEQTRGVFGYIKKLIDNGSHTDIIYVEELEYNNNVPEGVTLIEKIQHLGKMFELNEELRKQVNSGLGILRKLEQTDHKVSSAEVEDKLEALKESKLTISTRSNTGKDTDNHRDVVVVKIRPEKDVEINENYVRTDGHKIEVKFVAKVAGQLTAEVQVNGNHVSNSPLVMDVMPQQLGIAREFQMKGINAISPDCSGIAVNNDNSRIAVADCSSHCVYIINTDGDLLLTYTSLRCPQGISFLNETDLIIADNNNHRVCIVDTTTGTLVNSFGNQGNGNGQFRHPHGVHVDGDGNIIVCDHCNHRVQVFTRDVDYQYQFGLTKKKKKTFGPVSAVTHNKRFYVSDINNNVIHVFEKKGNKTTRISMIGGLGGAAGQLNRPWGMAIDNNHHLLVCDQSNHRIQKFTLDGCLVGKTCDGSCDTPTYLTVFPDDGQLLVTSKKGIVISSDSK